MQRLRAVEVSPVTDIKMVVAISQMDCATLAKHFTHRHRDRLGGMRSLPEKLTWEVEQGYRRFHAQIHGLALPGQLDHAHEPDAPEDAIDFALECIVENRDWGWKQIAGVAGVFAAFPDGRMATRVRGKVKFHDDIEEATDRLLTATRAVAR